MIHTNEKVIKHKATAPALAPHLYPYRRSWTVEFGRRTWKCLQSLQDDGLIAGHILSI